MTRIQGTHFLKTTALILNIFALGACTGLRHQKDDAQVGTVKRAAVVAFSVMEPTSAGIGLNLNSGKADAHAGGSMIPSSDASVDKMYSDLAKSFGSNLHWNVMPEKAMLEKPGYKIAYNRTMKGFQNKMPANRGEQQFLVKDLMDYDSPRILDVAGRDKLIDDLGVDAIVVARVDVVLSGTTVMGIGARHPQSMLSFFVYKKGQEKPIWFEGQIKGDEQESVGKTAFIDEKLLATLALKSADTAYSKIGASAE